MLKTIIEKLEKEEEEEDNDVNADMTQLERRNNKCMYNNDGTMDPRVGLGLALNNLHHK